MSLRSVKNLSRVAVGVLALSATYYATKEREEGFTEKPVVPVHGDRPTIGFGSTFYEDGTPVRMGDAPITRERGWRIVQAHNEREVQAFRDTLDNVLLFQPEFELFFDWRYQYGLQRWRTSGMLRELKQGRRTQACDALLQYKYMHSSTQPTNPAGWTVSRRNAQGIPTQWRFDCSTPGNKVCRGVHERNVRRHQQCMHYAVLDTLPALELNP